MKVGLFFGSFNPIHVGHLILAQALLNQTDIDRVWLVVSPQNPFKEKQTLLNAADRLRLCELATEGDERIQPSNVEFYLPQPSYTIDTLTHLAAKYPSYRFSILMGSDNLITLPKWKNAEAIMRHYPIYVYPRLKAEMPMPLPANVTALDAPIIEISATTIRALLTQHKRVEYLVPAAALAYIHKNGLYL